LSELPLVGAVVKSYIAHYRGATASDHEKFSETVSRLYARWSINFSAEYYEAKDLDDAATRNALGQPVVEPHSGISRSTGHI
jgi:hypothetical protein